eukprot:19915-Heterococcus_DN1.PRE.1
MKCCNALTMQAAGEGDRDRDGLYNQTQPRHLRRRTKSWTSRKAPASFRNKADAKGKKRKQPAQAGTAAAAADAQPAGHRKSLRRPRALLEERSLHGRAQPELADSSSAQPELADSSSAAVEQPQQQQQQRDLWLETHIWHAKRMTMGSCWGCALPLSARRGAKAAAAAAADHCTVRDASHWRALQLTGAGAAEIAAVLCSMCDPGDRQFLQRAQGPFVRLSYIGCLSPCFGTYELMVHNLHADAIACVAPAKQLAGNVRGEMLLHHYNSFPLRCIGPVEYLWDSTGAILEDEARHIWLWAHPAIHCELAAALQAAAIAVTGAVGSESPQSVTVDAGARCPALVRLELRGSAAHTVAKRVLVPHIQGAAVTVDKVSLCSAACFSGADNQSSDCCCVERAQRIDNCFVVFEMRLRAYTTRALMHFVQCSSAFLTERCHHMSAHRIDCLHAVHSLTAG